MRSVALWTMVTLLSACDLSVSEPSAQRRDVGIIVWQPAPSAAAAALRTGHTGSHMVIVAPDTVNASAPFDVTVTTIGMSGCWQPDGAELSYGHLLALVTPYDLVATKIDGATDACTGPLVDLPRTLRLVFDQTGVATLRVSGRKVTDGQLSSATPATEEQQIVVR